MNPCTCDCHRAAACCSTPCMSSFVCPGSPACTAHRAVACRSGNSAAPALRTARTCPHGRLAGIDARCSSTAYRRWPHTAAAASWRTASACWFARSHSCDSHWPGTADRVPDDRVVCRHGCSLRRDNKPRHTCAPARCATAADS